MEESAYSISIAAGIFYLGASFRLLRLNRRTRERPELLLGIYFACSGQWYLLYNSPYFLGLEALPPLIAHGIEWLYAVGVVAYLIFIRSAFRPGSAWATAVLIVSTLFLLVGTVAASLGGGFTNSVDDPAYLIEWVGYTLPCVWMCFEGASSHAAAKKRARIGLCDPVVANRYLLFACFGFFQSGACAAELVWELGNSSAEVASSLAFGLLGGTEIASVAALWLVFFPPPFFSDWITRRAAILPTPMDG